MRRNRLGLQWGRKMVINTKKDTRGYNNSKGACKKSYLANINVCVSVYLLFKEKFSVWAHCASLKNFKRSNKTSTPWIRSPLLNCWLEWFKSFSDIIDHNNCSWLFPVAGDKFLLLKTQCASNTDWLKHRIQRTFNLIWPEQLFPKD